MKYVYSKPTQKISTREKLLGARRMNTASTIRANWKIPGDMTVTIRREGCGRIVMRITSGFKRGDLVSTLWLRRASTLKGVFPPSSLNLCKLAILERVIRGYSIQEFLIVNHHLENLKTYVYIEVYHWALKGTHSKRQQKFSSIPVLTVIAIVLMITNFHFPYNNSG